MKTSNELKAFYQSWLDWATDVDSNGMPSKKYDSSDGLCGHLASYAEDLEYNNLEKELNQQFDATGLDNMFPFGACAFYDYGDKMHTDPNRLNFVKLALADDLESFKLI